MLDATSGNYPGGISTTQAGYARNLYGFLTGRVTQHGGHGLPAAGRHLQVPGRPDGGVIADDFGFFVSDSWRAKPNLTITGGLRWQFQLPMTTTLAYSRPETWQMVYGLTGAGSGKYGQGNLYKPGTLTGVVPLGRGVREQPAGLQHRLEQPRAERRARRGGRTWGRASSARSSARTRCSAAGTRSRYSKLGTSFFDSNYSGNPGRSRAASRSATSGTPVIGVRRLAGAAARRGDQAVPVVVPGVGRAIR